MTRCSYCDAEVPVGAALCPSCGANLRPAGPARFGSPAADGWIGGLGSFFGSAAVLAAGIALSQNSPWYLIASFLLAVIGGIVALALCWHKYPTLRLGLFIGLGLALLNPFTLCLGIIGLISLATPG